MELRPHLNHYEEHTFLALVEAIWNVEMDERSHDALITHFNQIVGHPAGSDLLFYSNARESGDINSPSTVVETIKSWHQRYGRAAFKDQALQTPPASPSLSREQRAVQSSTRNLEKVRKLVVQAHTIEQQVAPSFAALEQQLGIDLAVSTQEQQLVESLAALRELENAQYQAMRAVSQLEWLQLPIKLAQEGAVRDASSPFLNAAIQSQVLQEITAGSQRHTAALAAAQARHSALYERGVKLIESLEARIAQLAKATVSGPGYGPLTLNAAAHSAGLHPALLTAQGLSCEVAQHQHNLLKTFRSAIAELEWQATSMPGDHPGTYADIVEFVLSTPSDDPRFAFTVPLADIFDSASHDWAALAQARAEVDMPMRLCSMVRGVAGIASKGVKPFTHHSHVVLTSTNAGVSSSVRVRAAVWDAAYQALVFTSEGSLPISVKWLKGNASYTPRDLSRTASIGFLSMPAVPRVERFMDLAQVQFDDYIVVFPENAGIDPLYVMFRDRREI